VLRHLVDNTERIVLVRISGPVEVGLAPRDALAFGEPRHLVFQVIRTALLDLIGLTQVDKVSEGSEGAVDPVRGVDGKEEQRGHQRREGEGLVKREQAGHEELEDDEAPAHPNE
jgi:hypothetical protein